MEDFQEKIPAGCERLNTQAEIGARIGCTGRNVGLLLACGAIRPASVTARSAFYRTADLDAFKANALAQITQKCARLSPADRAHLATALKGLDMAGRPGVLQLSATAVDERTGIIRGATVARSGIFAAGKFVYTGPGGTVSPTGGAGFKKLGLFADDGFLDSLLAAVKAAGGKIRVRSDHDDTLASRAGYATNFKKAGDRVVCDLNFFDAYRDRAVVLEAAEETPELIGLSIDFVPSYLIQPDKAVMRVDSISAVDVVDCGAITPRGLLA